MNKKFSPYQFALIVTASFWFVSCSQQKTDESSSVAVDSASVEQRVEIKSVQPTIERFSWPAYLEWKAVMDKYYDTDLNGLTDSALLADVAVYNPVDMGWGDSNYIDTVFASSTLDAQGKSTYEPKNVNDNKTTAWIEGVDGGGIAESITIRFKKINAAEPVTSITIYNGFQASEVTYQKNSRPKTILLWINETAVYTLHLEDTMNGQRFLVDVQPEGEMPMTFRFEILDVYVGSTYEDTGITEIQFDGIWSGI